MTETKQINNIKFVPFRDEWTLINIYIDVDDNYINITVPGHILSFFSDYTYYIEKL